MANQQNPGGQGQAQRPKEEPPAKLTLTLGKIITENNQFRIPIEVRAVKGSKNLQNTTVRLKKGINVAASAQTDASGEAIIEYREPLASAGQSITLRAVLSGVDAAETDLTFSLPANATGRDDPELLVLTPFHDGAGNFDVGVRVLKAGGIGIAVPVTLEFCGQQTTVNTDDQGNALFHLPIVLAEGGTCKVRATVSGIVKPAKLKLRRPKPKPQVSSRRAWLFKTNNGRAHLLAGIAVVAWFYCFYIALGNSVFLPPQKELSFQQNLYNSAVKNFTSKTIPGTATGTTVPIIPSVEIGKEDQDRGDWQKKVWAWVFVYSFFVFFIYGPLSLREEIGEGIREGLEKMTERGSVEATDPAWERLAAWSGAFGISKKPTVHTVQGGQAQEEPVKTRFMDHFKSDILSDFIIEVVPSIYKSIRR